MKEEKKVEIGDESKFLLKFLVICLVLWTGLCLILNKLVFGGLR